jgi:hypothetical protein
MPGKSAGGRGAGMEETMRGERVEVVIVRLCVGVLVGCLRSFLEAVWE